jgi:adenylate cyclase
MLGCERRPRYVHWMEVERKFIVPDAPSLEGLEPNPIEQGYLAVGESGEVRLRRVRDQQWLTVKRGAGLTRAEEEIELSAEQFGVLWPLTEGRRLTKRRYVIPHEGLEVELDVYEGELDGLLLAEVEFAAEDDARAFEAPDWLGEDVTEHPGYKNESLAEHGVPGD